MTYRSYLISAACLMTAGMQFACSGSSTAGTGGVGGTGGSGTSQGGGGDGGGDGGVGGEGDGGEESWQIASGSGGCDVALYAPPQKSSPHVEECSKLDHVSNPPTTGPHYPRWAAPKTYDEPLPRGYYLHAMEHGAVVLAYNCSGDCTAEVAAMQMFVDSLAPDPMCVTNRIIITPDPLLDVPFAASAWGHMLKASCFDETLVAEFVERHYNKAPEMVCSGGIDPFDPAQMTPADCGE